VNIFQLKLRIEKFDNNNNDNNNNELSAPSSKPGSGSIFQLAAALSHSYFFKAFLNISSCLQFPNYSVFISELIPVLYVSTFCLFTALLALFFILHLWY
jgi:hypothetical protein